MSEPTQNASGKNSGPIAWMSRNSVAANLLMFVILVGGAMGISRTKTEVFPEVTIDAIAIGVPYPGASPEEVEQGIILAIEEAVRGLAGVDRVTSSSLEGAGAVTVELLLDADRVTALGDVKDAIDGITTFPEDAEEPTVSLFTIKQQVMTLLISGNAPLGTLHSIAEDAKDGLLARSDITQVDIGGVPESEISIEIPRATLESYGWTPNDIAQQIRMASLEMPAGEIESERGEFLLRVADRKKETKDFSDLILKSSAGGAQIRLGDVATITDGYVDNDVSNLYNGERAVQVTVYRVGKETPMSVSRAVKEYLETFESRVPEGISVNVWKDTSIILQARIKLLVDNAMMGLVLVLLILALFLDIRLAFWVALGIPISFMGAFLMLPAFDRSINMISLFAFIVTLGMVVDDAIIVGEHAFGKIQEGMEPMKAAISAGQEMFVPVTFAVLTTAAAFSPLFFVPGFSGKLFSIIPFVVVSVLLFSVLESFFILPAHVAHIHSPGIINWFLKPFTVMIQPFYNFASSNLERFIKNIYRPLLTKALRFRYVSVSLAVMTFIIAVSIVAAGLVPFQFFPTLEGNEVTATVTLPFGAPESLALEIRDELERAADAAGEELGKDKVRGMLTRLGEGRPGGGPGGGLVGAGTGSHIVSIEMSLVPTGERTFSSEEFATLWKKNTGQLVGVESLVFNSNQGPGAGAPVDVQLVASDTSTLAAASQDLTNQLRDYSELTDIVNGYSAGKPQYSFHLLPEARNLGLTSQDVARQLRSFIFGAQALREQKGRREVKVMVRLPRSERSSEQDIDQLRIRTPRGGVVPLNNVVELEMGTSATTIKREDGRRKINVTANLAAGIPSPQPVLDSLLATVLPDLEKKYPGLKASFSGAQREQQETMQSLVQNGFFAMFVVFALLAIPFRSYVQPFIVMSAIPFGFVGAVAGHLLMGFTMSIISVMGVIALAGVVVNDSLVLIDATNRARTRGMSAAQAVTFAGQKRFRPILLTSLTTFFGLMPMIFETSLQARFLIPMAISLGFGVLFATVIALLIVPAIYLIAEDIMALPKTLMDMRKGPTYGVKSVEHPVTSTAKVRH